MAREPMFILVGLVLCFTFGASSGAELLQNGGFESTSSWKCGHISCKLISDKHSGHHAMEVTGRTHKYEGPSQNIHLTPGHSYHVSAWVKLLSNPGGNEGEKIQLQIGYLFSDNSPLYITAAARSHTLKSDGWVHLTGGFTAPNRSIKSARFYFQAGPDAATNFVVDDASVTSVDDSHPSNPHAVIDKIRKSDIHINVTASSSINKDDVTIHVLQKKKSFPFGSVVRGHKYVDNAAGGKYRAFIHKHFNWAVLEGSLKWYVMEQQRGHPQWDVPMTTIHGLRSHGVKVRGHNLLWSVPRHVQDWVKALSGDQLRNAVKQHIVDVMNKTRGLLEHWDVNNENLHGTWFQDALHDPHYNLEVFRIAHQADPTVKLFLNDFAVVSRDTMTTAYLRQAKEFKAAKVGLYGIGAQGHFGVEVAPDPAQIKQRLDILAEAGLPIWITEHDVQAQDENKRANFYEKSLTSFYGHPAVEGILFWGFWDQAHWRGERAAFVEGDNLQLNAAGRRIFDLLENQWMTDDSRVLSQTGSQYTLRGFHGDYEVHVIYKGHDVTSLTQKFTLGKADHNVHINVHT